MKWESVSKQVSIPEAARYLSVSQDTIRRRIRKGQLPAHREATLRGHVWLVELPEAVTEAADAPADLRQLRQQVQQLQETIAFLREELTARRREVQQLLALLELTQVREPATARRGGEQLP